MSIRFWRKRRSRFLDLLVEQAKYAVAGSEALMEYMRDPSDETAQQVARIETAADETRRILIDELNRTFVTPFDREDIYALSLTIDDVLDYANTTVDEMVILRVEPNSYLQRMASLLADAAREIFMGVTELIEHPHVASDHAVRAKALENRIEGVYREALGAMFNQPVDLDHVVAMLKLRELYRHLSNAADRGDQAANVISDIVVKRV
jgi:predicted phosphate transport protein (TIGR00153 family)